jgi:hypothetical protein
MKNKNLEIKIKDDFKKTQLLHIYCDALLLEFKNPVVYDLSMPSAYNIYSLINLSLEILSGKKIKPKEVNCVSTCHDYNKNKISFNKLNSVLKNKNLSEKLFNCLDEPYESRSVLKEYLEFHPNKFRWEWFGGYGDWFEFRNGMRENVKKEVEEILPPKEYSKIKLLGEIFQPFVGLTNSTAKIK